MVSKIKQINNNHVVVCDYINNGEYIYKFYSYSTLIATYNTEKKTIELTDSWNYSRTTQKYLKTFLNDFCSVYYDGKKELINIINKGYYLNNKINICIKL